MRFIYDILINSDKKINSILNNRIWINLPIENIKISLEKWCKESLT